MNIVKSFGTHGMYNRAKSIKYIVIHYTAGVSSKAGQARTVASYFMSADAGGTADFIIDDTEVVQYNPDPRYHACRAVGGMKLHTKGGRLYGIAKNMNCVSIEMCSTNSTGKVEAPNSPGWSVSDAVVSKTAELTKYLMDLYGIDADHVIRHYDVTGKLCPGIKGWNADSGDESAWKALKAKLTKTETTIEEVTQVDKTTYKVVAKNGQTYTLYDVSYGDKGEEVRFLQRLLTATGYKCTADGVCGDATLKALASYQAAKRRTTCGKGTWQTLLQ